jgi:hypothetical protein
MIPQNHPLDSLKTLYIERNPTLVKSITSFPYIVKSL